MHYTNKEFSRNGGDTIQALADPSMPLGNINSPSAVDVLQINLLYKCPEALRQGTVRSFIIGTQRVQRDMNIVQQEILTFSCQSTTWRRQLPKNMRLFYDYDCRHLLNFYTGFRLIALETPLVAILPFNNNNNNNNNKLYLHDYKLYSIAKA